MDKKEKQKEEVITKKEVILTREEILKSVLANGCSYIMKNNYDFTIPIRNCQLKTVLYYNINKESPELITFSMSITSKLLLGVFISLNIIDREIKKTDIIAKIADLSRPNHKYNFLLSHSAKQSLNKLIQEITYIQA